MRINFFLGKHMKQQYSLDNRYSLIRNEGAELCAKKNKAPSR